MLFRSVSQSRYIPIVSIYIKFIEITINFYYSGFCPTIFDFIFIKKPFPTIYFPISSLFLLYHLKDLILTVSPFLYLILSPYNYFFCLLIWYNIKVFLLVTYYLVFLPLIPYIWLLFRVYILEDYAIFL